MANFIPPANGAIQGNYFLPKCHKLPYIHAYKSRNFGQNLNFFLPFDLYTGHKKNYFSNLCLLDIAWPFTPFPPPPCREKQGGLFVTQGHGLGSDCNIGERGGQKSHNFA